MTDAQELLLAANLYRSAKERGVIDLSVVQALVRSFRARHPGMSERDVRRIVVKALVSIPARPASGKSSRIMA